ncbi:tyrosine-type recombinase/integrase [Streptomyces sp. NPDC048504]|uniref:tyrosine-type recombinase/integrase n=1 Tax=Streptomyces sp. NPDC048504 TaxID=3365559 RepID=UPI0037224B42
MARRNANGEGSVTPRKDGRWEAKGYILTTSGIKKRVSAYGATRAEAKEKLGRLKAQNAKGMPVSDKTWLLGDYLDHWLESFVKMKRRPATYAQCETMVRLYLKPGLGRRALDGLTVPLVQGYMNEILAEGTSVSNVHVIRKVLSAALTRAQKEELVSRNVARLVDLPVEERKEINPWSMQEVTRFFDVARGHRLYAAYQLLFSTGLRKGELLGLHWEDIDTENRVIHVRQQLQRVGRQILIGPLKTTKSRRDLPLLDHMLPPLADQYEKHPTKTGLVFTTPAGNPIEPTNFLRDFKKLCKDNGLRVIPVHWVRHTVATLLKKQGVADRDIQLLLGHSRIVTTQEVYQHDDADSRRNALQGLAGALLPTNTKAVQSVRPGLLSSFIDDTGCRQNGRQTQSFVDRLAQIISGGAYRIRTDGLFHAMKAHGSVKSRATEVDAAYRDQRRRWMVGAVVVKMVVKNTRSDDVELAA